MDNPQPSFLLETLDEFFHLLHSVFSTRLQTLCRQNSGSNLSVHHLEQMAFTRERLCRCHLLFLLCLNYMVWRYFTTSCRKHLRGIWGCWFVARPCTFVSRGFTKTWVGSLRPGLVKLLALSHFQARRRSPRDSSFTGHFGQFVVISWYLRHRCLLSRSNARSCHRYLEPNDCSAPPPPLVHRRWLDSGMVFSSLTHSTSEE